MYLRWRERNWRNPEEQKKKRQLFYMSINLINIKYVLCTQLDLTEKENVNNWNFLIFCQLVAYEHHFLMAKKYLTPLVLTIRHAHLHRGRIWHPHTKCIYLFLKTQNEIMLNLGGNKWRNEGKIFKNGIV